MTNIITLMHRGKGIANKKARNVRSDGNVNRTLEGSMWERKAQCIIKKLAM